VGVTTVGYKSETCAVVRPFSAYALANAFTETVSTNPTKFRIRSK